MVLWFSWFSSSRGSLVLVVLWFSGSLVLVVLVVLMVLMVLVVLVVLMVLVFAVLLWLARSYFPSFPPSPWSTLQDGPGIVSSAAVFFGMGCHAMLPQSWGSVA